MLRINGYQLGLTIFIVSVIVVTIAIFLYYIFLDDNCCDGNHGINYNPNIEYINNKLSEMLNSSQNPDWYSPPALPSI